MAWQRKTPFGYTIQNGVLTRCPKEAAAVKNIFTLYLEGASYNGIAEEMTRRGVPYHQHTPQWNKHMVKRILENEKYMGADGWPRLISDETFLSVRFRKEDKTTYAPCPEYMGPIREKAVCGRCGTKMVRDTKSHGRPRWRCQNPECGASIYADDASLRDQVTECLKELAKAPHLLAMPRTVQPNSTSLDALRIQNEINLGFNRSEINSDFMKTLIFAAAAERYGEVPDPTRSHSLSRLRERLEQNPADARDLRELFEEAVSAVRIGQGGEVELELAGGRTLQTNGKEQTA